MGNRMRLHQKLLDLMPTCHKNVYFQPPESIQMKYPCLIYKRSSADTDYANDMPYMSRIAYEVTIVDSDPDSNLVDILMTAFPLSRFNRHYVSSNLNHDVIVLYEQ